MVKSGRGLACHTYQRRLSAALLRGYFCSSSWLLFFGLCLIAALVLLSGCGTGRWKTSKSYQPADTFKRFCLVCDLRDDPESISNYQAGLVVCCSDEIVSELRKSGVLNLTVYRFRNRLFMVLDTDMVFRFDKDFPRLVAVAGRQDCRLFDDESLVAVLPVQDGQRWILIDRIYKLDQKREYDKLDGYVEVRPAVPTRQLCEARQLIDDPAELASYRAYHAMGKAWPEITAGLKDVGIVDMEIYMVGSRTFKLYEVVPDFDPAEAFARLGKMPRSKEWGALVGRSDRPFRDKDGRRVSQFAERIFQLN